MQLRDIPLFNLPPVEGIQKIWCAVDTEREGEVRIVYTIDGTDSAVKQLRRLAAVQEEWVYDNWHAESRQMVLIISCREDQDKTVCAQLMIQRMLKTAIAEAKAQKEAELRKDVGRQLITTSRSVKGQPPKYRHRRTSWR